MNLAALRMLKRSLAEDRAPVPSPEETSVLAITDGSGPSPSQSQSRVPGGTGNPTKKRRKGRKGADAAAGSAMDLST